ncbi:MAG: hypothetical protein K2P08_02370 [Oscillospiraceae bacterium]|nr:hypothetical protein [Oscillospiraceae bacterium]
MDERKQTELSPPPVGGASLLVVFAVLCLTVFALLSLSTVRANGRLSETSARAVADYYAADVKAQEILARLRAGEEPEGVEWDGFGELYASYSCPISDQQELRVEVRFPDALDLENYEIVCWQAVPVGQWETDDELDVWDGDSTLF